MLFFGTLLCLISLSSATCSPACGTDEICTDTTFSLDLSPLSQFLPQHVPAQPTISLSSCINTNLSALLGTDVECQTSGATSIGLPTCSPFNGAPFSMPVDSVLEIDSSGNGCANAVTNENISLVLSTLVACTLTDEIRDVVTQLQCASATGVLNNTCSYPTTVAAYPQCACQGTFDVYGIEAYDYIPELSNWIVSYLTDDKFSWLGFDDCSEDLVDIDCDGLVEDCRVNEDPAYTNCTEEIVVEAGGWLDLYVDMCLSDWPKYIKRSEFFEYLKKDIALSIQVDDVTLDLAIESYRARKGNSTGAGGKGGKGGKGGGNSGNGGNAATFGGQLVSCGRKEVGYAVQLAATWPTEYELFMTVFNFIQNATIPDKLGRQVSKTLNRFAENGVPVQVTAFEFNMTLYTSGGLVVTDEDIYAFFFPATDAPQITGITGSIGNSGAVEVSALLGMMMVGLLWLWN